MVAALFLLALGLTHSCVAAQIPVEDNFDYEQVTGQWHRLAMILQGAEPAVVGSRIRMYTMTRGDISVIKNAIVRLTCRYVVFRYRNAGMPGVYNVFHPDGQQSKIHVVATDYDDYLVLHIQTGSDRALYLFGKGLTASNTAKEVFKSSVYALRFHGIVQYPKPDDADKCPFPY